MALVLPPDLLAAERGYAVAICYANNRAAAEAVFAGVAARGAKGIAVQADVAREADVLALFARVDSAFGPLTALVNNAGILERQIRLELMDVARFERVMATNVIGTMVCAREAVRRMSTRHGGRGGAIVNLSSAASRLGSPSEFVDYAASKGAVDSFTLGLAREVAAERIRVNAVRPGLITTDIHAIGGEPGRVERVKGAIPMQRGGSADEVAQSILWLLSDEAS